MTKHDVGVALLLIMIIGVIVIYGMAVMTSFNNAKLSKQEGVVRKDGRIC